MFNHARFDTKFKHKTSRALLKNEIETRLELHEYKEKFTFKKLMDCQKKFTDYIEKYGEEKPVNTSYKWFNSVSNYAISYTHFIPTNQPYAKKINEIIKKTLSDESKSIEVEKVVSALKQIKSVEKEMKDANITGTVKTSIEETLKVFELDTNYKEKLEKIENTLKYIPFLKGGKRIISPI